MRRESVNLTGVSVRLAQGFAPPPRASSFLLPPPSSSFLLLLLRDSVLCLPTDIHSLFVNKPSSSSSSCRGRLYFTPTVS